MVFAHRTNVLISPEDKKLLNDLNIGYSEAIKKFCHEQRLAHEMILTRGLAEAKERIDKLVDSREKFMEAVRSTLNEQDFNKFLEKI